MAKITISRQQLLDQLSPSEVRKYHNSLSENIFDRPYYHNDEKQLCKNGEKIEIGTHGPETKNGKTYISIYHYLEYLKLIPNDYKTLELGAYLTNKAGSDYIICKYSSQSYKIHKYQLDLLQKEEKNNTFQKYFNK